MTVERGQGSFGQLEVLLVCKSQYKYVSYRCNFNFFKVTSKEVKRSK